MLGKLFNLTAGAAVGAAPAATNSVLSPSNKTVPSLESVQEDIHTRNLLFPDTQALYQHRHDQVFPLSSGSDIPATSGSSLFDCDNDFELDTRDVRILVMQDSMGSIPAMLLYDSQATPPPPPPPSSAPAPSSGDRGSSAAAPTSAAGSSHFLPQDTRRGPTSPRKPSLGQHSARPLVIQPGSPQLRQSAFDRRPSIQNRSQPRAESEPQRAFREYTDELGVFSSCMFGNSELLAYKGTSTKVHVVPAENRADPSTAIVSDGRGSLGRSSMRASKLSQSFSSDAAFPLHAPPPSAAASRSSDRKKVLITRLFPVALPSDDDTSNPNTGTAPSPRDRFPEDGTGYPFPTASAGDDAKLFKKKKPQPRQKRTPMYAVALVVNLPHSSQISAATTAASRSGFRGPGSYTEQQCFPSSYGSTKRTGWNMATPGLGIDMLDSVYVSDLEERIDPITQHWDIIMRTLTHLQSVVATAVFAMLKQADLTSPDPAPPPMPSHVSRAPSLSGRRHEEKPPKTNAKVVTLVPNCLMDNAQLKNAVECSKFRVVAGLRASRVITGQNRWGIWRDEARWVARWAGSGEQSFLFNLLTGFLATHTDWLQALSPADYRRRHFMQQSAKAGDDVSLPARTIIVAQDKIAARRLIFLLSAFLPASQPLPNARAHRPSTSASWGAMSQSPPSYVVPILKEESLRRKINRKTGPRRPSHSRNPSSSHGQSSTNNTRPAGVPAPLAHLSMYKGGHDRRPSDAASIKTANLPIPGSDVNTRKSSAATTTTITQEATIPHFATVQRAESALQDRPGSASSAAADDLKRTLRRGDSTGHYSSGSTDSRQSSRWGSVISGLWSGRRRDSTASAAAARRDSLDSRREGSPKSPIKPVAQQQRSDRLSRMVQEAQMVVESPAHSERTDMPLATARRGGSGAAQPQTPRLPEDSPDRGAQNLGLGQSRRKSPDPTGAFVSPVKTSINVEDGVIDVDVPFPDYITSFETAVSSPSSSGYLSTPGLGGGLEAFEQSCRAALDADLPMNVAGWLQRYHPDFVLQAVPASQGDYMEQIRASMRAEPSPALASYSLSAEESQQQHERWLDISSAVIADATNFTVTRVRYRRLVRPKPAHKAEGGNAAYSSALLTPAVSPYETQLEDEFIVEPITAADARLAEAVERVMAHHSGTSEAATSNKGSSNCSSRSASVRRGRSNSESAAESDDAHPPAATAQPALPRLPLPLPPHEVPRAECKTVILSALEDLVKEAAAPAENGKRAADGQTGGEAEGNGGILKAAVRAWLESVERGD